MARPGYGQPRVAIRMKIDHIFTGDERNMLSKCASDLKTSFVTKSNSYGRFSRENTSL